MASKPPRLSKRIRQQVAEELGEQARSIIHDIKAPINMMRGYSQIITKISDVSKQIKYAESIDTTGGEALAMIDDLIGVISGLRIIAVDDAPQPCDLSKMVRGSFWTHHLRSDENLRVDAAPEISNSQLEVWGFEHILRGIISNLVTFAQHRSTNDDSVVITRRDDKEGVWLVMQDQGPPLDENLLRRTGHGYRELVIASVLCKLHDGRLEAQNLPEGGVEVAVLFPKKFVISAGNGG